MRLGEETLGNEHFKMFQSEENRRRSLHGLSTAEEGETQVPLLGEKIVRSV